MQYVRTFREILARPENVIDSFVLEERTKFQHPFLYGLIGVIFIITLNSLLLNFNTQLQTDLASSQSDQLQQLNYWIEYANLKVSTQFLPLSMFLLFVLSLSLPGLFFFRDDIDGFYYNLILSCYAIGTSIIALLLMIPVWLIDPSLFLNPFVSTYLPILLVGIIILRIYKEYFLIEESRKWIQVFSSYILGAIIFLFLKSFSVSIIGYFIFAVNRFLDIWMTV